MLESTRAVVRAHSQGSYPAPADLYTRSHQRGNGSYTRMVYRRMQCAGRAPRKKQGTTKEPLFMTFGRFGRTNTPTRDAEASYRTIMRVCLLGMAPYYYGAPPLDYSVGAPYVTQKYIKKIYHMLGRLNPVNNPMSKYCATIGHAL